MEEGETEFLQKDNKVTDDEIIRIVRGCANLGIKKVRITGGEPLVRPNIVNLIRRIGEIEGITEIYLTTNGILLEDKVNDLAASGVKGVNISLDSLKEDVFKKLTRGGELTKVLNSIDKCLEVGIKVKLNTVIVNDINSREIFDFIKLTLDKPIDVRFIELMPIGVGKYYKGIKNEEIINFIKTIYSDVAFEKRILGEGPAKYIKLPKGKGKVGFISAISNCFCEQCNRIRVTSDGFMKQCLHYNTGINLKDIIRDGISDEKLQNIIKETIYNKPEKHRFNEESYNQEIKLMNQIGG